MYFAGVLAPGTPWADAPLQSGHGALRPIRKKALTVFLPMVITQFPIIHCYLLAAGSRRYGFLPHAFGANFRNNQEGLRSVA